MKNFIQKLVDGKDLTEGEACDAMEQIMKGKASDAQIGGFLIALKLKGESPQEIKSFAEVMKKYALPVQPKTTEPLIDMCGTGGDGTSSYNVSTCAMFIAAAAGVKIAKHGNRSITSNSGSADVLEALGANIHLSPENIAKCIDVVGIGFMFAPDHHPAMKYVMPARKQLGVRTVFNILGPLVNPAPVKYQLMGVFSPELTEPLAQALKLMGHKAAFVVHGGGLDELTPFSENKITELKNGEINTYSFNPKDLGLSAGEIDDVVADSPQENANLIKNILAGKVTGVKTDIALLNAAAAITLAGIGANLKESLEIAKKQIESGAASRKLKDYIEATNDIH